MKKIHFSLIVIFLFSSTCIYAQESTNTCGGTGSGSGGSFTYSIGQVFYSTTSSTTNSAIEGVQQPYEISVDLGKEITDINFNISVFPNPSIGTLTLALENYDNQNLSFELYDNNGKLIQSKKISKSSSKIDLSSCVNAIYYIKVVQNNQAIKTFKIVKI